MSMRTTPWQVRPYHQRSLSENIVHVQVCKALIHLVLLAGATPVALLGSKVTPHVCASVSGHVGLTHARVERCAHMQLTWLHGHLRADY